MVKNGVDIKEESTYNCMYEETSLDRLIKKRFNGFSR